MFFLRRNEAVMMRLTFWRNKVLVHGLAAQSAVQVSNSLDDKRDVSMKL